LALLDLDPDPGGKKSLELSKKGCNSLLLPPLTTEIQREPVILLLILPALQTPRGAFIVPSPSYKNYILDFKVIVALETASKMFDI
jgi:hypothetical protein